MTKSCVFHLPLDSDKTIDNFKLKKVLTNDRTSIYENDNMRFSFDSKVVRVLIFDVNEDIINILYSYFYQRGITADEVSEYFQESE